MCIDKNGTNSDALLNRTDATSNHNKHYRIQPLAGLGYNIWTTWGRIGGKGQSMLLGDVGLMDAIEQFESKIK